MLLLLPCASLYGFVDDSSASKEAEEIEFNDAEDDDNSLSDGKKKEESKLRGENRTESGDGGGGSGGGGGRGGRSGKTLEEEMKEATLSG